MPEELLPYKRPQPENPLDPQNNILSDANLLGKRELFKAEVDIRRMMIRFYRLVIVVVCVATLALFITNLYYTSRLDKLNTKKNALMAQLANKEVQIREARIIQRQVNFYKSLLGNRKKMAFSVGRVFQITNDSLQLLSYSGDTEKFSMVARTKEPSGIVKALYSLLNSGEIKSLVLNTVDLDTDTKIYRISLQGFYK